jgi:hypothetical protein
MTDRIAYKVLTADQFAILERDGCFAGAPVDLADGYIHLSTAAQLAQTIDRHFAGQTGLVIWIAVPTAGLDPPRAGAASGTTTAVRVPTSRPAVPSSLDWDFLRYVWNFDRDIKLTIMAGLAEHGPAVPLMTLSDSSVGMDDFRRPADGVDLAPAWAPRTLPRHPPPWHNPRHSPYSATAAVQRPMIHIHDDIDAHRRALRRLHPRSLGRAP